MLTCGVKYATLYTSESVAGQNSTAGEFWPDNGAMVSVNGSAETSTQQAFIGDATSTTRTYRPFTVRLPLAVTQVASVQYVYRSNYDNGLADDDIRYRNIQINQCKATLRVQKVIGVGRAQATDQFTLRIANAGGTLATTTTTGTGTTVGNGVATHVPFAPGTVHTLSEIAAGTTNFGSYSAAYVCTNASSGTGTALPSGSGTGGFNLTPTSGDDITCTFTNTRQPTTVTLAKVSQGGTGTFAFTGSNGLVARNITTVTAGVAVSTATQTLTTPNTSTTITEGVPPAGFVLTNIACTGLGAGGTATNNLATRTVTLDAAATAAGSAITCTFTNARQPTVTIAKVSQGGVGTFAFTGSNGLVARNITTVTAGTAVSTATQTLTTANTSTTITEGVPPAGFVLSNIACTGLGAGGSAINNLATRTVTLDAAATAPGSSIACTFTNIRQPILRLQKAFSGNRLTNTDQVVLSIAPTAGGSATTVTTTGTGSTVSSAAATLNPAVIGTAYTLSEAAAGTMDLGRYTTTYNCTNAFGGSGTTMPSGSGTSFGITPATGDDITCIITNTRRPVTLTLTKISEGGTRAFTFTGNNGWSSQTITTTVPGVGVTGATQTLNNPLVATTINESLPSGFVLDGVTCTGMGPGGSVTVGASSFTLNAAAVDAGSEIACTVTNRVQSQPPFPGCTSEMYLSQSPNTNTVTTLYQVNTATNPFTYPVIGVGSNTYNGIGFNPGDNYIYGINQGGGTGNRLIRIGSDGSSVDLGPVAGMGLDNWINGTFSADGTLYVLGGGGSSSLRAVNVQTNTSTLIPLTASVNASDFAWINGLIYVVQQGNGQLRSIDPVTGQVLDIGSPQGGIVFGSMFGAPSGLFGSDNDGGLYQIDLATGVRTLISASPPSGQNDGASCPTAPITFNADLSVTKTNTPAQGPNDLPNDPYIPGEVRTYSIVVTNLGPFGVQNASVTDPLPAGVNAATASWTCASTSGGAVCGAASGTGALNDVGLDLPANAVATYLLTLTVPTGFTGALSNTVTVTPPSNINDTNTGNNTATDVDTQAAADLSITKTNGTDAVNSGGTTTYTIVATNNGPSAADNAVVSDDWITLPGLDCSAGPATCAATGTGGTQCPAPASVTPAGLQAGLAIPVFPSGGIVTFTLQCTVTATGSP